MLGNDVGNVIPRGPVEVVTFKGFCRTSTGNDVVEVEVSFTEAETDVEVEVEVEAGGATGSIVGVGLGLNLLDLANCRVHPATLRIPNSAQ